jgi:hypothetical protein
MVNIFKSVTINFNGSINTNYKITQKRDLSMMTTYNK